MKVLIFGCGPSAMIATHAATMLYGADVQIVSIKRMSQLYGCQYLHQPIPCMSGTHRDDWRMVDYRLFGTFDEYQRKVYGDLRLPSPVSPQQLIGQHPTWDLRSAYARLYEKYEHLINDYRITGGEEVPDLLEHFKPDVTLSSVPAPFLCQKGDLHAFLSVRCWAIGDAPERGQLVTNVVPIDPFTVVCDGSPERGWYRASNVWGSSTVEWPGHRGKPPVADVVEFKKPLTTDCDCLPAIQRIGRYGKWQKGVLSHQAWQDTVNALEEAW